MNLEQITRAKMPHIVQSSGKGCPIACATMVLNLAGINKSYKELQKIPPDWKAILLSRSKRI